MKPQRWDIFCQVIDNFGDIGVCWRLSCGLAARGVQVRLWVDDASALAWMAPEGCPGVEVRPWTQPLELQNLQNLQPSDVWVEAFGCDIAPEFVAACVGYTCANGAKPLWINLEYLSAERYVERSHALPSLLRDGPAAGRQKWFFYPGFSGKTGGLLRETNLAQRQTSFDRSAWLQDLWPRLQHGFGAPQAVDGEQLVSLFCYEPPALQVWLEQLASAPRQTRLLVTAGRASRAVQALLSDENCLQRLSHLQGQLSISYLPALTQRDFDHLLWAADWNLVRGEDSLVRAIWAGKPFVWQIYPQHDAAHHVKLEAFLDMAQAPDSLRQFQRVWNGLEAAALPVLDLETWGQNARDLRARLLQQADLVSQLLTFQSETR
ncbi:putative repeat protein (TIGR03837 family) [Rhodoferax ferrireducens]|uniref:Protein-arginine rhamnosyltransferase n=1 Tax=Rhodoferax ferrireducens TaxID=192843 RepID=A0ABU2C3W3_9BURK|nr:elongation factor P maturation arginine rhamnosyltransferase EarP [Rhodoferax ferrireducens]MDR7376018.1 putative repeat protein (TIGR03837 family) [Rhodoferax ferrireducens]